MDYTGVPKEQLIQIIEELKLELERKNNLLAEQIMLDGLTQVKNHRSLIERLNSEISTARRTHGTISIVLFDLDDFKLVNDLKGHLLGDMVLVDVAKIIQKNTRDTDVVGRYGGEEFMIILPNADHGNALRISNRIRQAIEEHHFFDDMRITVSGGIKEYGGETSADFIRSADENLYIAKSMGKNRVI